MKRLFIYLVVLLLPVMHVFAVENVLFVSTDGTGDGSSWVNASSFTAAAEVARVQEVKPEIWVKAGTYIFSAPVNFDDLFIYGGFSGDETALNDRNWATNLTIFDGNDASSILRNTVGAARLPNGNATVIPCLLDGVIVQNGLSPTNANGGGMIINNGAVIRNCVFRNNATQGTDIHGAAIHCNTNTIVIENSLFVNNTSIGNGGAIQIGGATSVTIRSCTFANNKALYPGGAIGFGNNTSNLTLYNTIVYNNLYGTEYNSFGSKTTISGGGVVISNHSAVESTSTKFTNDENDVDHLLFDRGATVPIVPGFVAPATVIGKGANETEITEINNASYRITKTSPCLDAGLNSEATVETIPYDLDHTSRIFADYVDMGAYECIYEPDNIFEYPSDAHFKTSIVDNELRVSGALMGEKVQLYDVQGKMLNSRVINSDNEIAKFRLSYKGIYLVSVQNKVIKVNY